MFNPSDALLSQCGIHEAIHSAVLKCPKDVQPILYRNIMMTGGNTGFKNFRPRVLDGVRGKSLNKIESCKKDVSINFLHSVFFLRPMYIMTGDKFLVFLGRAIIFVQKLAGRYIFARKNGQETNKHPPVLRYTEYIKSAKTN